MKTKMYLKAVSGDLSAGAMCDKAMEIEIEKRHLPLVKEFLKADANFKIEASINPCSSEAVLALEIFYTAFDMLKSVLIFNNKYEARTTWEITYKEVA